MPTLQFPKGANVDTAFVVQDDGTKNRVVMTAAQDISNLELPENPNSTKGYITVNGKKQRVVLVADIVNGGNFIRVSQIMPEAGASVKNQVHIYTGATNANFTRGYIYECVGDTVYTGTVSFEAATISGITVSCDGDDFAAYVGKWRPQVAEDIVSGTLTYDQEGNLWVFDGKDSGGTNIAHFQLYQEDYEDAGFTFSGTPADGDVVAFTCSIEEDASNYSWERLEP